MAATPYASVQLNYEARPDIENGFDVGTMIQTSKRLVKITRQISTDIIIKKYNLAYQQSPTTQRSELVSLTECTENGLYPNLMSG